MKQQPNTMPWSIRVALLLAKTDAILRCPPALPRIVRPVPQGLIMARFILPLELCKPQNEKRGNNRLAGILATKTRKALASCMASQCRAMREPLPGRPQVIAIRFSSGEPDRYSDWGKQAIDVLCPQTERIRERLNIIRDDAPKFADVNQHWEPAAPGGGWVYLEVRSGES